MPHLHRSVLLSITFILAPLSLVTAQTTAASVARTTAGATLGAAGGILVGAVIGAKITSGNFCRTSNNPDYCLGEQLPGIFWGGTGGATLGAAFGAHYGNRQRGSLPATLGVSLGLLGAEILTLRSLVHDGRTAHRTTVWMIGLGMPAVQVLASTVVQLATSRGATR